jgi:DGQHR domain-containing protein
LKHSTPSWRIEDPERGFQRIVREDRARQIALTVLAQRRTFPNAIVLATNAPSFRHPDGHLRIPGTTKFLVVDGQHRLWAQKFATFEATYACVVHMGLDEVKMAELFLEINDNQKRVPASLRWDLVRLVRPDDDPFAVAASEMVYDLAMNDESPLYQRIDLTGEQPEISLKQGSVAPELRNLISAKKGPFARLGFDKQYEVLLRYLAAVRALDSDGWKSGDSPFYKARVLRVLLRLLPIVVDEIDRSIDSIPVSAYKKVLERIDKGSLAPEAIRAVQGSAGMNEIFEQIKTQVVS